MLKRNLIIIAVMTLGMVFTDSAFGQERRPPSVPPSKNIKKTGIKRPVIKGIKAEPKTSTDVNRSGTSRTRQSTGRVQPPQPKGMNKSELVDAVAASSGIKPNKSKTQSSNSPINVNKSRKGSKAKSRTADRKYQPNKPKPWIIIESAKSGTKPTVKRPRQRSTGKRMHKPF